MTSSLRTGAAVAGTIASIVLVTAAGRDVHDVAWFIYYGWSGADLPMAQAAPDAGVWVLWSVVGALAMRWTRAASIVAWVGVVALVVELAAGLVLPTAQTGAVLQLALLSAWGLSTAPRGFTGVAILGRRRVVLLVGAVLLVLLGRLLGHHYLAVYTLTWVILGVAVLVATRPRTPPGRWAVALLGVPALSVAVMTVAVEAFAFNVYRSPLGWSGSALLFYGSPVLVAVVAALVLVRAGERRDAG